MVVQTTHGMTEHIGRYEQLAEQLTANGIAVAGFDLRGHGRNPGDTHCASFGEGGWKLSLHDMHLFYLELESWFPAIPHFMLGFSLGSFLLRDYAKKKEQEGYIRLSIDEEMWKLYGRKGIDYPEEQYEKLSEQVEAALQKKLLSLIQQGKDVVIDFSFWSKENRNVYKELIQKAGAETELVYMKASKELLQKRLYKRNQVLNANSPFVITDELLEHHYHAFQEPCGEGEKVILQKEDIMQYSNFN